MLRAILDVAPFSTWAILSVAATLLLAGFILLSHTLVRSKAYGDAWGGVTSPGRLEWTLRVGAACLLGGVALWMIELDAPTWAVIAAGVAAGAAVALEGVALTRR